MMFVRKYSFVQRLISVQSGDERCKSMCQKYWVAIYICKDDNSKGMNEECFNFIRRVHVLLVSDIK